MAKSKFHVGLEIGTSATRVVVAEIKPDLSVKILGIGETRSIGVRKGEIVDLNQARKCVKAAILQAEELSSVSVQSVFIALTGSHIRGVNNVGTIELSSEETIVTEEHVKDVEDLAIDYHIKKEERIIHTGIRKYELDGEAFRKMPVGFVGKTLSADFHLVYGSHAKFQNSMRLIKEYSLEVDDTVFSPIASAQVVLRREHKEDGALVIDVGAGTTDYILYIDGVIQASGSVPIGGDHITNDIHLVTHVPISTAEQLKVESGDVSGSEESLSGVIEVESEYGHDMPKIDRRTLNMVIKARLEELFRLVAERLPEGMEDRVGAGVFLTGGVSKTVGIDEVLREIMPLEITLPKKGKLEEMNYADNPQLATVLGLIYYAQIVEQYDEDTSGPFGFLKKIFS